ncbi:ABC transporter permease [Clostridia bacterium]|nr:ABC transporter permease [Clostridia bacterium]
MIKSRGARAGDMIIALICILLIIVFLLPIVTILMRSLSSPTALLKGQVWLWPIGFSLDAYKTVLNDHNYSWSLIWTAILTVTGTVLSLFMTTICAYPLTYPNLKGKTFFNYAILLTMYFNAGTIPTYLLLKNLGMLNQWYVLILPYCLSVFNMIIMRSFFYGIPDSLRESAELDGAGPIRVLVNIYLPLSMPVIATLSLFYAVGRWNGYSDALMFISPTHRELYPIQLLLYQMINSSQGIDASQMESIPGVAETLKSASIMFATVPILLIYPWLQRYFIAGATLGAVKE